MNSIIKCNICGNDGRVLFDLGDYHIRKCLNCRFSWVEEVFDEKILSGRNYYWAKGFFIDNEQLLRAGSGKEALLIKKCADKNNITGKRWLDIGSGFAYLISEAVKIGYEVTGIEVNKETADYVCSKEKLNILTSLISDVNLEKESFDIITLFDVLEHLLDPKDAFLKGAEYLKKNGLLVIEVPDDNSLIRKLAAVIHVFSLGKWSQFLRQSFHSHPGGHRNGFTEHSLRQLLKAGSFEVLDVRKVMIPYKLYISETVRKKQGINKMIFYVIPALLYACSRLLRKQNRIKVYAKKI
ncbi:MAG: class I SAM-dependent methyltransferase [Elusimicrobia bacterium]|nr:class I SAM-dependent methyltransferase [Elusimicrobiota bacterium]